MKNDRSGAFGQGSFDIIVAASSFDIVAASSCELEGVFEDGTPLRPPLQYLLPRVILQEPEACACQLRAGVFVYFLPNIGFKLAHASQHRWRRCRRTLQTRLEEIGTHYSGQIRLENLLSPFYSVQPCLSNLLESFQEILEPIRCDLAKQFAKDRRILAAEGSGVNAGRLEQKNEKLKSMDLLQKGRHT